MENSRERQVVSSEEVRASRERLVYESSETPEVKKHLFGPPSLPGGGSWKDAVKVFKKKPWKDRGPKHEPPDPVGHYGLGVTGIATGLCALYLPSVLAAPLVPFLIGFGCMRIVQGIVASWQNPLSSMSLPGYIILGSSGSVITFGLHTALGIASPLVLFGCLALGLYAGTLKLQS